VSHTCPKQNRGWQIRKMSQGGIKQAAASKTDVLGTPCGPHGLVDAVRIHPSWPQLSEIGRTGPCIDSSRFGHFRHPLTSFQSSIRTLKYRELEKCSKTFQRSVRLAVRSWFSVNYDESRNERAIDRKCVTNGFFAFQSLTYNILMIRKIFWMSVHASDTEIRKKA